MAIHSKTIWDSVDWLSLHCVIHALFSFECWYEKLITKRTFIDLLLPIVHCNNTVAIALADPISRNSCVIYYFVVVYHYSFRWQKDICIHVWLCNMLSQEVNILGKRERERKEERERERVRKKSVNQHLFFRITNSC